MSSTESESDDQLSGYEDSITDDNVENDTDDDEDHNTTDNIVSNAVDDLHINTPNNMVDDDHDIEDTNHFRKLYNSFENSTTTNLLQSHPTDNSFVGHIRSAMGPLSHSSYVSNISSNFGDSLDAYLFVPPLIQRTTPSKPYYFSYDPTISVSSPKLFVGNVTAGTTWQDLKAFFVDRGYSVNHVIIPHKPVCIYKVFYLKLCTLNIVRSFRMSLVSHLFDLAVAKLLLWYCTII